MTQYNLGVINPLTTSGPTLADILSGTGKWREALESSHKGPSRPSYAAAGMLWVDDSDSAFWKIYCFDGTDDILIALLDLAENSAITPGNYRFNLQRFTPTNPQMGTDNIHASTYAPELNRFIAVGAGAGLAPGSYSSDGINWTAIAGGQLGGTAAQNWGTVWAPSLRQYVAVGTYTGGLPGGPHNGRYSSDGITWTQIASGQLGDSIVWGVAWSEFLGRYVAVGTPGTGGINGFYSSDGINWTAIAAGQLGNSTVWRVVRNEKMGLFIAVGLQSTTPLADAFYSADGITWNSVQVEGGLSGIASSERLGRVIAGDYTSGNKIYYTDDGAVWTQAENSTLPGGANVTMCHYADGLYHFIAGSQSASGNLAISADGVQWSALPSSTFLGGAVYAGADSLALDRVVVAGTGGLLKYSL